MSDLPKEIGRGNLRIGGMDLVCIQLDDGRRVFEAESFEAFMNAFLAGDLDITEKQAEELGGFIHNGEMPQ